MSIINVWVLCCFFDLVFFNNPYNSMYIVITSNYAARTIGVVFDDRLDITKQIVKVCSLIPSCMKWSFTRNERHNRHA